MKSVVVCAFLLALAVSSYGAEFGDGRPGCKTEEEVRVALYRNIWDPTAYWKCEKLSEAASVVRCPDQEAFQDSLKKCVTWDDWEWEEPRAPPSKAFLLALAVSSYGTEFGDGRPGCKTEEEVRVALYRNIWNPTAYWKCEKLSEAASVVRCPDQEAFQDSLKKCVTWDDWEWEEPRAPPSKP